MQTSPGKFQLVDLVYNHGIFSSFQKLYSSLLPVELNTPTLASICEHTCGLCLILWSNSFSESQAVVLDSHAPPSPSNSISFSNTSPHCTKPVHLTPCFSWRLCPSHTSVKSEKQSLKEKKFLHAILSFLNLTPWVSHQMTDGILKRKINFLFVVLGLL